MCLRNTARTIFRYGAHGVYAPADSSEIRQDGVSTPAGCYVASWPQRSHESCRIEPKNLTWCVCACVGFHVMEDRKGVWVSGRREVVGSARTDWAAFYSLIIMASIVYSMRGSCRAWVPHLEGRANGQSHHVKANIQNGQNNTPRHLRAYGSNRSKRTLSSHPSQVPYTTSEGSTSLFIKKPLKHRN